MNTVKVLQSDGTTDDRTMKERLTDFIERMIRKRWFSYFFMVNLLIFMLLSGYILFFSGSLFIEAIIKGWWRPDTSEFDSTSLWLGFLFGFSGLMGVVGGITVFSTNVNTMFKFKVLFFLPSVNWYFLQVIGIFFWPIEDWYHLVYLVPALLLCVFILFNVMKKVQLPYMKHEKGL